VGSERPELGRKKGLKDHLLSGFLSEARRNPIRTELVLLLSQHLSQTDSTPN
jgi:hypothetical protein